MSFNAASTSSQPLPLKRFPRVMTVPGLAARSRSNSQHSLPFLISRLGNAASGTVWELPRHNGCYWAPGAERCRPFLMASRRFCWPAAGDALECHAEWPGRPPSVPEEVSDRRRPTGEPGISAVVSPRPVAGLTPLAPQRPPPLVSGREATSRANPGASSPCRLWRTEGRERMLQIVADCLPVLTYGHRIRLLRRLVVHRWIQAADEVEDA